jgi:hypothetical protein
LVSALRDEGPHVVEWIAHHRALGVTDFLLFTNDCGDGTDAILDLLPDVVRLDNVPPQGKSVQWNALRQAWDHPLRKAADWILCIDSDEFVNLRAPLTGLPDLIAHVGAADAVILPWRLFGHNGQAQLTEAMTLDAFTRAAPEGCDYPVVGRQFKTLFRAKGPFRQIGVHRPRLKREARAAWVDGSGQPMPDGFDRAEARINLFGLPAASALVQLNHYSLRSAQSFLLKRERGLPNRTGKAIDMAYWVERNFNTVEDRSIQRLGDRTRAEVARLMALPGVAALHRAAHAHHHARFEALMRDADAVRLYGRLLLAATSVPLAPDQVADVVRRFGAAAHG